MSIEQFGLHSGTTIRDSLYDIVPVSAEAALLLSTAPFQRLERIQQLGFVSRIWPSARHSRFEHSIGVMHLMTLALEHLQRRGAEITPEAARAGIAAALLHDIGHYPFSHAIEELGPPVRPHEQVGRDLILREPIAGILADAWRVEPERVASLVHPAGAPRPDDVLPAGLLSGALDVDKLDYLPRDAHGCAVPYGRVDVARLLASLTVVEVDGARRLGIDDKGISPLHSLINARQAMFDNVYWHHTNRACMAMLLRAVQELVDAGIDAELLTTVDDTSLLAMLTDPTAPEISRRLGLALRDRQLHKRAIEISAGAGAIYTAISALFQQPTARREREDALGDALANASGLAVRPGDVLIDIPKPERWRSDVWVQFSEPPLGFRHLMPWLEVAGQSEEHLKQYENHRRFVRIVTTPHLRDAAREQREVLLATLHH